MTDSLRSALDAYEQQLDPAAAQMSDAKVDLLLEENPPPPQRKLSHRLDLLSFNRLISAASLGDRLRLQSVSSRRSAAWLQAMPSRGPVDLTLTTSEMQVLLQHRLGVPLLAGSDGGVRCPIGSCEHELDDLGHHQLVCSHGGFVTSRHNRVRDAFQTLARASGFSAQVEQGSSAHNRERPADILVSPWTLGKPVAFDVTVVSPHVDDNMSGAGNIDVVTRAEERKLAANTAKCAELGWTCVPLAVDTFGQWGEQAHQSFGTIATHLAVVLKVSLTVAINSIYNTLGLVLARQNARAILARRINRHSLGAREVRQLGYR